MAVNVREITLLESAEAVDVPTAARPVGW